MVTAPAVTVTVALVDLGAGYAPSRALNNKKYPPCLTLPGQKEVRRQGRSKTENCMSFKFSLTAPHKTSH